MNRTEFIKAVAAKAGATQVSAKKLIESMESVIMETLAVGDEVNLKNFGTWRSRVSPSRLVRKPNGETVRVDDRRVVRFIPSETFKQVLNGDGE